MWRAANLYDNVLHVQSNFSVQVAAIFSADGCYYLGDEFIDLLLRPADVVPGIEHLSEIDLCECGVGFEPGYQVVGFA